MRLEFFGDEVESIREFDPATQRSTGDARPLPAGPGDGAAPVARARAAEALRQLDWSTLRQEVREEWDWQVRDLEAGAFFAEAPFFARYLLPDQGASLLDYLPGAIVLLDEPRAALESLEELDSQSRELEQKLTASGRQSRRGSRPRRSGGTPSWSVSPAIRRCTSATARPWCRELETSFSGEAAHPRGGAAPPDDFDFASFDMAPTFGGRIKDVIDASRERSLARQRVVLVSQQAGRLTELYGDRGVPIIPLEELQRPTDPGTIVLVHGQLGEGWSNPALGLFLLTDTEIFGWAKPRRVIRRRRIARESFLAELKPGDFVVHIEHGIAQYQGLVRRRTEGGEREYLLLQFAGSDRVYVPTDQLDRVDRYIGVGDHARP